MLQETWLDRVTQLLLCLPKDLRHDFKGQIMRDSLRVGLL